MDNYKNRTKAELIAEIARLVKLSDSHKVKDDGELLEKIAENYPNSYISIIEKDLTISFISGEELKKQGLDPNAFIGLSLEQIFAEHAPIVKKHYLKTFKGKEQRFELFFNEQYQLFKSLPLTSVSGNIDRILTIVENITERRQALEKLKGSEEKFRSVFEKSPVGKSMTRIDGALQVNKSFCDILGYSEQELKTKKWQLITHPDDISISTDIVQDLLDGKQDRVHFEKRYIHKNGYIVWTDVITSLERDNYNNPEYFITSIQDITERKLSEQAIREKEVLYQELVDTINSGVAIYKIINNGKTGRDYIIQDFNKTALELEGLTKEQVLGKSLIDIRPNIEDYGLLPIFEKVWKTGEPGFFPSKEYTDNKYSNYYENRVFRLPNGNIVAVYDDVTERENTALLVKKSKERLDLALNATKDGLYDWNLISNEIYYSPPWKSMLGYKENELPNDFSIWEKLTMPEDVERSWKMQQELINKKRDRFEMEFKMKHKDGHWVDVFSRAEAVFDESGKAIRMVGTHVDITERKKAELALKDSEEKFRVLYNSSPDMYASVSHDDATVLFCNDTLLTNTGYTRDELVGAPIFNLYHNECLADAQKAFKQFSETGKVENRELILKRKDGSKIEVSLNVDSVKDETGKILHSMSSWRDISKQKLAEEDLSKSLEREKNLGDIVRNAPIAIGSGYPDGRLENCNKVFFELTGYTEAELKNLNWNKDLTPAHWNDIEANALQQLNSKNNIIQYEKEYIHKNGTVIPIELFVYGKFDEHNNLLHYVAFLIDITERKQFVKTLQERNEYIESIMESMPIGFAMNTIDDGDVKYMNDRFEEIYGWSRDILTNTSVFFEKIFPDPKYRKKMATQIKDDLQSGDPKRLIWKDMKIVTSTGEVRYVSAYNIPLLDQNLMISTAQDTTQVKLAEDEITKHREHLEEMVKDRTKDLEDKNKKLEKFNDLFVDREFRIKELRDEIEKLSK